MAGDHVSPVGPGSAHPARHAGETDTAYTTKKGASMPAYPYPWTELHGTLSVSLLKLIDAEEGSPAEFFHACKHQREATDAMKIGTCAHWHMLGGPPERRPLVYSASKTTGEGAVKAWRAFQAQHAGEEIFGSVEWDAGLAIARGVHEAPHNANVRAWLADAQTEVPLRWELPAPGGGPSFEFSTRGVDVVQPHRRRIADVKKCASVRRHPLERQAHQLRYMEQLVLYESGVRACLWEPEGGSAILAVCASAPYCAVALPMNTYGRVVASERVDSWLATLRTCLDRDDWPGPEGWDLAPPAWAVDAGLEGLERASEEEPAHG